MMYYFYIKNDYFLNYFFFGKILAKYSLKRTKLHHFKKISRGSMPPNPPSKRLALPRAACAKRHANAPTFPEKF